MAHLWWAIFLLSKLTSPLAVIGNPAIDINLTCPPRQTWSRSEGLKIMKTGFAVVSTRRGNTHLRSFHECMTDAVTAMHMTVYAEPLRIEPATGCFASNGNVRLWNLK